MKLFFQEKKSSEEDFVLTSASGPEWLVLVPLGSPHRQCGFRKLQADGIGFEF